MNLYKLAEFQRQFVSLLFVITCLPNLSWAEQLVVYPCTDFGAIRWVRDSTFCDQYYICHFGQPLAMPSCPIGHVWSNSALNCVPQKSRWDDCTNKSNALDIKTLHPKYFEPSKAHQSGESMVISIKELPILLSPTNAKQPSVVINESKKIDSVEVHEPSSYPGYAVDITEDSRSDEEQSQLLKPNDSELENVAPKVKDTKAHSNKYLQEKQQVYGILQEDDLSLRPRDLKATLQRLNIDLGHQCVRHPGALLPHSENCHWYFNCSLADLDDLDKGTEQLETSQDAMNSNSGREGFMPLKPFRVKQSDMFVWECRYPQLFDDISSVCREFVNVDCKSRFEPVDQCEYSARKCSDDRCIPCDQKFGRCRGRQDGVYPLHQAQWTPAFVTCYRERNIAQDECIPPTPIFSPEQLECVSLFDVPKIHGGFLPDCSSRPDGYYPDEQGRCAIFFRCALGRFRGYDECPPGTVFDPAVPACLPYRPCGEGQPPLCAGKLDGYYADPYGRCTNYFECQDGIFQQYLTCDLGIFDPLTQRCVVAAELTVRPCGLQPSPCEELPTGVYPDIATGCKHFIECHQGNMITNGTCKRGHVFSAITGQCDVPEFTPPPCGVSTMCLDQPDGRYPALTRGCSFFYECYHGEFLGLRRCTESDGGIFFNPDTGTCDYPQNICPPCGYKWWGCPRTYQS